MDSRHRLVFLKVIYEEAQHADHNNNHSRRPSDLAGIFDKIHKVPPNLGDFVLSCYIQCAQKGDFLEYWLQFFLPKWLKCLLTVLKYFEKHHSLTSNCGGT